MSYFNFAGSILEGEYLHKSKLYDGTIIYKFKDKNGYIYSIKKEDICGNFKR